MSLLLLWSEVAYVRRSNEPGSVQLQLTGYNVWCTAWASCMGILPHLLDM